MIIILLGINIGMHGGDRRQLIAADGAGEDLLFASGHIKAPSLRRFYDRHGQTPCLATDIEPGFATLLDDDMFHLPVALKAIDGGRVDPSVGKNCCQLSPSTSLSAASLGWLIASASARCGLFRRGKLLLGEGGKRRQH